MRPMSMPHAYLRHSGMPAVRLRGCSRMRMRMCPPPPAARRLLPPPRIRLTPQPPKPPPDPRSH